MFDQLQAGDDPGRVDADEDADRLARVADGAREVGVEVYETDAFRSHIDWADRRVALWVTETRRPGKQLLRCRAWQELGKVGLGRRGGKASDGS